MRRAPQSSYYLKVLGGYLLTALCLSLVLILPYFQAWYGLDWGDMPYHILYYTGQRENTNVFTFFTPWVGRLWGSVFGFGVMPFRMLEVTCLILMHVLPLMLLFRGEGTLSKKMPLAALGLVMAVNVTLNVYGYDSFSTLVFCLIFLCAHAFIFTRSNTYAAWLGVLTGIAVAARLPNGLTAFTLSLTILAAVRLTGGSWRKAALGLSVYAFTSAAVYLLLFVAYDYAHVSEPGWNVISAVFESIRSELISLTTLRGSHSSDVLINNMVRDINPIFTMTLSIGLIPLIWESATGRLPQLPAWGFLAVGIGFGLLTWDTRLLKTMALAMALLLSGKWITQRHRYGSYILLAALLVFFILIFKLHVWDSAFRRKYLLLVTSASLVTSLGCVITFWLRGDRLTTLFSIFSVLLAFHMPLGSNTGLWKSASIFTFTAPVLFLLVQRKALPSTRILMTSLAVCMAALSLIHKTVVGKTFMDGRMHELTVQYDHPLIRGIRTTPLRKQNLDELTRLMDSLRTENEGRWPVMTGSMGMMMQYLSGQPEPIPYTSMAYLSEFKAEELATYLKANSAISHVILTYYYPDDPRKKPEEFLMIPKLRKMGFKVTREGLNYQVFSR